jgi:hypothetical protein
MGIVFNNNSNMSLLTQASLILTPTAEKAGKLYSVVPSNGNGDMDVVRGTTATRVNSLGLVENVAVNEPRLNYEAGSPSILIEPQRTNLLVNSVLSGTGATPTSWAMGFQTGTSTPVQSIKNLSINAYRFITSTARQEFSQNFNLALNSISCFSVFVESVTTPIPVSQMLRANQIAGGASTQVFLKNNIVITSSTNIEAGFTYTLQVTCTISDSFQFRMGCGVLSNVTGNVTLSMPQLETGNYATSYIPTLGSAITRNADGINNTSISPLIGQTEGTFFIDFQNKANEVTTGVVVRMLYSITDGTVNNRFSHAIVRTATRNYTDITIRSNNVTVSNINVDTPTGRFKIAVSYKIGATKMFINGVLVGNVGLSEIPIINRLFLGCSSTAGGENANIGINTFLISKTALTDTECINLTTL